MTGGPHGFGPLSSSSLIFLAVLTANLIPPHLSGWNLLTDCCQDAEILVVVPVYSSTVTD